MFLQTPYIQDFSTFETESVPAGNNMETRVGGFSGHVGYETMNNLVHFNDVAVNPWDPGLIFLCLGPCPLKHYGETGQWIFLRFS